MVDVASASVALVPNAAGFGPALSRQVGPQVGTSGKGLGGLLGKGMLVGFAAVGVAAGVGKVLFEIGETFDDLSDTIRVSTGETGKALESLNESAKKVGTQVAVSFD